MGLFGLALTGQMLALVALWDAAPTLAYGAYYTPATLASAHLFGLAFLTVAIMAALMQLVPVVLRQQVGATWRAASAGVLVWCGGMSLAMGLWTSHTTATAAGGTAVLLGGGVFVVDLAMALIRAARRQTFGASGVGLAMACGWFAIVIAMGAAMAGDRTHTLAGLAREQVLAGHATLALMGWIGGTILAVALRLGPMFLLSHGYAARRGATAMAVWHLAVAIVATGMFAGHQVTVAAGAAVTLIACVLMASFFVDVIRRRRRRVEAPMAHLVIGVVCAAAAASLVLAATQGVLDPATCGTTAVVLMLVGVGAGVTGGHTFKVVPMLVWTGRYAHLAGTPSAPRLSDMYPHRLAVAEQLAFVTGLAAVAAGVLAHREALVVAGIAAVGLAAVSVTAAAAWCVWGRHVPPPTSLSFHSAEEATT